LQLLAATRVRQIVEHVTSARESPTPLPPMPSMAMPDKPNPRPPMPAPPGARSSAPGPRPPAPRPRSLASKPRLPGRPRPLLERAKPTWSAREGARRLPANPPPTSTSWPWLLRGSWDKATNPRGIGSWSPDLAVSPALSSPTPSDGVAMGARGWATRGEQNTAVTQEEEETDRLGLVRGWEKKKRNVFFNG
jgi:hypothetical protein